LKTVLEILGKKSKCDQHLEELFNQTDDEVELLPNELKRKPSIMEQTCSEF